jgi:hypothetical protein
MILQTLQICNKLELAQERDLRLARKYWDFLRTTTYRNGLDFFRGIAPVALVAKMGQSTLLNFLVPDLMLVCIAFS